MSEALVTAATILAATATEALGHETVEILKLGGNIVIREVDGNALVEWSTWANAKDNVTGADGSVTEVNKPGVIKSCGLLTRCMYNAAGVKLFEDTRENAERLAKLPGSIVNKLCAAANRVNGLSEEAKKETAGK